MKIRLISALLSVLMYLSLFLQAAISTRDFPQTPLFAGNSGRLLEEKAFIGDQLSLNPRPVDIRSPLPVTIPESKLTEFGHAARIDGSRINKKIVQSTIGYGKHINYDINELKHNGQAQIPWALLNVKPRVDAATAQGIALTATANRHGILRGELNASKPRLLSYMLEIDLQPGDNLENRVWFIVVRRIKGYPMREFVLVDAGNGAVKLQLAHIPILKNRAEPRLTLLDIN